MGAAQAEMFDLPQGDLFGTPATPAYVIPHAIAVNTLRKTLALLTAAERWPWDPDMKAARMDRTVPKLLAVLTPEEAQDWRGRIDAQAARLDAAATPLNPPTPAPPPTGSPWAAVPPSDG